MSLRGHGVRDTCVHIAGAIDGVKAEPDALLNARAKVRPLSKAAYGYMHTDTIFIEGNFFFPATAERSSPGYPIAENIENCAASDSILAFSQKSCT